MRLVLDTDVMVAALRSPQGGSAALLIAVLRGEAQVMLSVALALEYEAICHQPEHRLAAGASHEDVENLLAAVMSVALPVEVHYQWRPQLSDAGDEMVLEAAINGRADAIVSFNHRDYKQAPSRFGLALLTPAEALRRLRK